MEPILSVLSIRSPAKKDSHHQTGLYVVDIFEVVQNAFRTITLSRELYDSRVESEATYQS